MVIKISLSNRAIYTILLMLGLILFTTGVYAVSGVSHDWSEISGVNSNYIGYDFTGGIQINSDGFHTEENGEGQIFIEGSVIDANKEIYIGNGYAGGQSPQKVILGNGLRIKGLSNCDTIDTDAEGNLVCGTDENTQDSQILYSAGIGININDAKEISLQQTIVQRWADQVDNDTRCDVNGACKQIHIGTNSQKLYPINKDLLELNSGIQIMGNTIIKKNASIEGYTILKKNALIEGNLNYYEIDMSLQTCVPLSEARPLNQWHNNAYYSCDIDLEGIRCPNAYDGCIVWKKVQKTLNNLNRQKSNCNAVSNLYYEAGILKLKNC